MATASSSRSALTAFSRTHRYLASRTVVPVSPFAGPSSSSVIPPCRRFLSSTSRVRYINPKHASSSQSKDVPRDHGIPFRHVQLVNPETGSLEPPTSLASILRSFDHETHSLVLVQSDPPIVKLLSREEERAKQRLAEAKERLRRKAAAEQKEVQISWGSADGDVMHKVDIARTILERGDRVQLVFAPRSGGGQAAEVGKQRKEELVTLFREALADVGMKWREDEVTKTTVVEYWQAQEGVRVEKRQKMTEKEVEKKKEKEEKKEARRRKEEERRRKAGVA